MTGWMNLGGSSSARTSKRTKAVACLVASVIPKPAVAAAWRSSQPSPRTANACARRSAAGSMPRTRAITRRPMPSSPPASSSAGSISARCRSLSSSATRSSSVRYSGLPPLAIQTASDSRSLDLSPIVVWTSALTAPSLNNVGRSIDWRFPAQRQQRRAGRKPGHRAEAQRAALPPIPLSAGRGRSTSATRVRLPSGRHQPPAEAAERPIDWQPASTARAKQQRMCRRPSVPRPFRE